MKKKIIIALAVLVAIFIIGSLPIIPIGGSEEEYIPPTIYEDEYIKVSFCEIDGLNLICYVTNKTDTDISLRISDLYLDGTRFPDSSVYDDIYAGETDKECCLFSSNGDELIENATTLSGKIKYITAPGIYDDQPEFEINEVDIN